MNLTKNFTLEELTHSATAKARGISNKPSDAHLDNLMRLCVTVLQPMREQLGRAITITSGYRSEAVNKAVGGVQPTDQKRGSQHLYGEAADIRVAGMTPLEVCRWIEKSGLPFDQVIHEKIGRSTWTHVSVSPAGRTARAERLTYNGKSYLVGLHEVA